MSGDSKKEDKSESKQTAASSSDEETSSRIDSSTLSNFIGKNEELAGCEPHDVLC